MGRLFANHGRSRRPIEMSERNFFSELKRRNLIRMAGLYSRRFLPKNFRGPLPVSMLDGVGRDDPGPGSPNHFSCRRKRP